LQVKIRKKTGLQAAKNLFFGFEKKPGLPGFSVSVKTGLEVRSTDGHDRFYYGRRQRVADVWVLLTY